MMMKFMAVLLCCWWCISPVTQLRFIILQVDNHNTNDYRPIPLLSNFNRILEKLVFSRMESFIFSFSIPIWILQSAFNSACNSWHYKYHSGKHGKMVVLMWCIYHLGIAQMEKSKWLVLTQSCKRYAMRARVKKASKQPKEGQCLPCGHLVQGKRHVEKKALLAGYFIPVLRSET